MSRPVTSLKSRFWSKVEKTETCWNWTGALGKLGYGNIEEAGRCIAAHRASYQMAHGDIPVGLHVCHRCDNRRCVNPTHLFLGTNAENMRDASAKGRMGHQGMSGERNASSKLRERDIPFIRGLSEVGFTRRELSAMYGVSTVTVNLIVKRRAWSHVP